MAEISDEKYDILKRLYHAAINFRRAQLEFCDQANCSTMKDLLDYGVYLHRILKELNGGNDPVHFISRTGAICSTAAMLAKN